jgi:hypothetical protein
MAAGSHLMKGSCALLVIAAIIKIAAIKECAGVVQGEIGNQWVFKHQAIRNKIKTSPTRLVIAVIIAAP